MAGLHFDITADNHVFVKALREIQDDVKRTTSFLSQVGKGMDFSSMEKSIVSLTKQIGENEAKISKWKDNVARDMKLVASAFEEGDLAEAQKIGGWIDDSLKDIEELTKKTEEYKEQLSTLSLFDKSGLTSERIDAPMFFLNKEDYDYAEQLRQKIEELKVSIGDAIEKGQDTSELKNQLSDTKTELAELEVKAMDNATAFGRVGRAAADSATRIFELKDAVKEQIAENERLTKSLEEAKEAYEQAKEKSDTKDLEAKRAAYDGLVESVRNGTAQLRNLENALSDEKEKLKSSSDEWGKFSSLLGKIPGPIGDITRQITSLVGEAKQAATAMDSMTAATGAVSSATLAYIAIPILAFLAALAAAYEAVKTWMDRTREGQEALAVATSRYNQVLDNLKGRVAEVGGFIYQVFDGLTKKIEELVGGLDKLLGVAGSVLGQSLGGSFGGFIGGIIGRDSARDVDKAAQLAKDETKLREERIKLIGVEADAREKIRQYEFDAYDMSLSAQKRQEAIKKAEAETVKLYKEKIRLAEKEAKINKKRHEIDRTDTLEDDEDIARHEARIKELNGEMTQRLKSLKRMGNRIVNQGLSEVNKAAQLAKQQEAYKTIIDKQTLERERAATDMEFSTTQAQINAMKDGSKKTLRQIELDYQKQAEAIERGRIDIKRKKIEDARNAWLKNPANKGKSFDESSADVKETELEKKNYEALVKENEARRIKSIEEVTRAELQSMNEYLKAYGSMSQKRLAIEREYYQKIDEARTEGEKMRLTKELQAKKASLSFEEIANDIDWISLFGGIENMTSEMMKSMYDQLKAFQQTDKYKEADAGTKQQIASMLDSLRNYVGSTDQKENITRMGEAVEKFNDAVTEYKEIQADTNKAAEEFEIASQKFEEAQAKREQAEKDLSAGKITQEVFNQISPTAEEIKQLGNEAKAAEAVVNGLSQAEVRAKENVQNLGQAAKEAAEDVKKWQSKGVQDFRNSFVGKNNIMGISSLGDAFGGIDSFKGMLDEGIKNGLISDGAMKGAAEVLSDKVIPAIDSVGEGVMSTFSEGFMGTVAMYAQMARMILQLSDQVKSYVTGILDSFTDLVKFEWLEDLVVSITESISNLVNAIFDLPENLYKALEGLVVNGVGDMLGNVLGRAGSVLSLGGLSTDWLTNAIFGSDNDFEAATKKWGWLLDSWEENLDYEKSLIEKAYGKDVLDIAGKTVESLRETQRAARELYDAWAGSGASLTSHSHGYNANRDAVWQYLWDYDPELARKAGVYERGERGSLSELINNFTADELERIVNENRQFWSTVDDTAKEYIQTIIDVEKSIPEVEESAIKQLTDLDLSTLESQFSEMLNNWDEEAKDFSEDFEGYMKKAIMKSLLVNTYSEELKKWREKFSDAMENGLDENEAENLRSELQGIFDRGRAEYEQVVNAAGLSLYSSSKDQQATASMADKATYDQFELYLGIATAQQIALEQGKQEAFEQRNLIISSLQSMQTATQTHGNEIVELLTQSNGYLFSIRDYNKKIYEEWGEKFDTMIEKLEDIA